MVIIKNLEFSFGVDMIGLSQQKLSGVMQSQTAPGKTLPRESMKRFTRTGLFEFHRCKPVRSRRRKRRTLFRFYVGLCGVTIFGAIWAALWLLPIFEIQIAADKSPMAMLRKAERMVINVARGGEPLHPPLPGSPSK